VINCEARIVICIEDRPQALRGDTSKKYAQEDRLQDRLPAQVEYSLADVYETYEAGLRRYARNLTADQDWADDLVSETMFKAMPRFAVLSQLNAFQCKAWLYRVLKNQFLDDLRTRKRQKDLLERLAWLDWEPETFDLPTVLDGHIPAHHRRVLHMRYGLDMSSEEIAQKLGIPSATVRSRLRLAIQWIKNHQDQGD
jgi:RNA polymerase sigma factor (sigma-70 family)